MADDQEKWDRLYKAFGREAAEPPAESRDRPAPAEARQGASSGASSPAPRPEAPSGASPPLLARAGAAALDVAESIGSGLQRGIAALPGTPADIVRLGQMTRDYMRSTNIGGPSQGTYAEVRAREDARREAENPRLLQPSTLQSAGSQRMIERADEVLGGGLLYEPTTPAGRFVAPIAEAVGGAAVGGGLAGGLRAVPGAAIRQGLIPGAAVGGAQAMGVENPLALAGIGVAAGGAAELGRPTGVESAIARRTGNATPHQVQQAENLFQQAQAQNLPLSRANALDYVTQGATDVSGLQRVVEGQAAQPMRRFYADAPERVGTAGDAAIAQVAPTPPGGAPLDPNVLGPRAAQATGAEISDVQAGINQATRPAYTAIDPYQARGPDFDALMQNRLFAAEHQRTLNDPALAHLLQNVAPDSVGAIDLTRRRLEEQARDLANPGLPGMSETRRGGYEAAAGQAQDVARETSRQALPPGVGGPSPLELLQVRQAELRAERLDPLTMGPEGRLAAAGDTRAAQAALFPRDPVAGTAPATGRAVAALVAREPEAGPQLVRNYLATEFANVQRGPQSGPSYYAAPAFWRQVAGNPEQRQSLEAALRALPDGAARAEAFNETMRVFAAMGQRQRIGSQTAFNADEREALKNAGLSEGAMKVLGGGGLKLPQKVLDTVERWRLGQNVDEIAQLFTNPTRGADFARLAATPRGSAQRIVQWLRLLRDPSPDAPKPAIGIGVREEEGRERRAAGGR